LPNSHFYMVNQEECSAIVAGSDTIQISFGGVAYRSVNNYIGYMKTLSIGGLYPSKVICLVRLITKPPPEKG
jgi:hypothetical protein